MKGYKQCSNNHFYKDSLAACPHCSKDGSDNSSLNTTGSSLDKTQNLDSTSNMGTNNTLDSTQTMTSNLNDATHEMHSGSKMQEEDLDSTHIHDDLDDVTSNTPGTKIARQQRRLVGWLVSYTIHNMGRDFRLYEGRNTIGTKHSNDIILTTDSSVSGHHATLLFRGNKFFLKDELSSNGTFLNDNTSLAPNETIELIDGCKVKMGNTIFKFRTAY